MAIVQDVYAFVENLNSRFQPKEIPTSIYNKTIHKFENKKIRQGNYFFGTLNIAEKRLILHCFSMQLLENLYFKKLVREFEHNKFVKIKIDFQHPVALKILKEKCRQENLAFIET